MYNAKKTMCLAFDRTKDLSGDYNDCIPILLNGSMLEWVKCVKHLGNYISYDLSEEEKIRHKKGDFIQRVNVLLKGYRDANQNLKCICLIHSVVITWSFSNSKTDQRATAWNGGVRKIWRLPFESHRNILCGLNNGEHIWDCIFKRCCGMSESNNKNKTFEYLSNCATKIAEQ